jgi:hypothetical protein
MEEFPLQLYEAYIVSRRKEGLISSNTANENTKYKPPFTQTYGHRRKKKMDQPVALSMESTINWALRSKA